MTPDTATLQHRSTHDADPDARNNDILIYVDGEIVHRDAAKVSVYDSGFMLGDGMWEGLRLYDGVLSFLDAHLDRLYEAALFIDLDIGMDRGALTQAIWDTLRANDMHSDVHLRVMVTRGRKRKPFQHPDLETMEELGKDLQDWLLPHVEDDPAHVPSGDADVPAIKYFFLMVEAPATPDVSCVWK